MQDVLPQKKPHVTFHFLAGLLSGLSTSILLQPADLLKTRVQQSHSSTLLPVLRSILSSPNPLALLWRGTLPSALRTGFGSALYFSSLNVLRQGLAQRRQNVLKGSTLSVVDGIVPSTPSSSVLPRLTNSENLLTGAVARTFAGFLMMPVTVIKVRYESDIYAYRSILGASRDILSREGLGGFFTGFGATAVRDAPYAGLYVVCYEGSKKRLNGILGTEGGGMVAASVNFVSGVFAAGLATSITNPFDAVKTRLQLWPAKYGNMVHATKLMLKEDGIMSFFDGLGLRMGRKALSSALAWTVYEELIGRAERKFSEERNTESAL